MFKQVKSLIVYRFSREIEISLEALEASLKEFEFVPCNPQDKQRFGWCAPLGEESKLLTHGDEETILITSCREEKVIPPAVINAELAKRCAALKEELGQDTPIKKKENDKIKDDILLEFLPRAFSRTNRTNIFIFKKLGLVVCCCPSHKKAEDNLALLRKTLGSLPVVPAYPKNPIDRTFTGWLLSEEGAPAGVEIQNTGEMVSYQEKGPAIKIKDLELHTEEVMAHLDNNMVFNKLRLNWKDRIWFDLDDECKFKKVSFSVDLLDQNNDVPTEDPAARFDADFFLLASELKAFFNDVFNALGGLDK